MKSESEEADSPPPIAPLPSSTSNLSPFAPYTTTSLTLVFQNKVPDLSARRVSYSTSDTRFLPSPEESEVEVPMVEGVIAWAEEVMKDGCRPIDMTEGTRPLKSGRSSIMPA